MSELSEGIYKIAASLLEMRQWCTDNLVGYWQVDEPFATTNDDGSAQTLFVSVMEEEDIVLFKLRWMGPSRAKKAPPIPAPVFSLGDEDMMLPDFVITFPEDDAPSQ